jgi:restriction endonuclease S subunit
MDQRYLYKTLNFETSIGKKTWVTLDAIGLESFFSIGLPFPRKQEQASTCGIGSN